MLVIKPKTAHFAVLHWIST